MSDIKIIETRDGSSSLLLPEMNETYHSTHGAITESEYVFIQMGLEYYVNQYPEKKEVRILEVGFGTGLNVWLTALSVQNQSFSVNFSTLEKFPLEKQVVDQLNYTTRKNHPGGAKLFNKIHQSDWENEIEIHSEFLLTKYQTDIADFEGELSKFDLIYFDAFAPSRQPEMWSPNVLNKMHQLLSDGGVFVTYCAQGQFKRDLKATGFKIEILDGPPGKKEMTRGLKI